MWCLAALLRANLAIRASPTLLHGAFQWLQPRSPVVQEVVESGRGPDPPDARAEVRESARPSEALARANRHAGPVDGSLRPAARALAVKPLRANRAVVVQDARRRHARAAAVAGLAVNHNLRWLVLSASRRELFTRPPTWASAPSTQLLSSSRIASSRWRRQPVC